ncbi:uncharacterized protein LOC134261791 [Saccostrea cucullata]|uniref:uncharacterized protein LOC134261791 n=1 Tax=Saccostrea cuccullata TaxID=36930 RepID=UPI002ED4EA5D
MGSKYHNSESHGWFSNIAFGQERHGNSLIAKERIVNDQGIDTSSAHSSWIQRSSHEFRQNIQDNSKAENERFETIAWTPVEREETDIAVYQTSESKERRYESDLFMFDRHAKTKDEMSKVKNSIVAGTLVDHQKYKESIENASIAEENSSTFYQRSEKVNRCPYCCSHNEANKNMAVYCASKKTGSTVDSGCQTDVPLVPHQTLDTPGNVLHLEDGQMNRQSYGRIENEKSGWEHYSVKKSSPSIMMSSGKQTDESKCHFGTDSSSCKFEDRVISEKVGVKEGVESIYSSNPRSQDNILRRMQVQMFESKANELGQRAGEKTGEMRCSLNSDTILSNIKAKGKNRSDSCKYELSDERQNGFLRIKINGTDTNSWTTETIFKENEKDSFDVDTPSTSKINIDTDQTHLQHEKNGLTLSVVEEQEQTVCLQDGSISSKTTGLPSGEMEGYVVNNNDGMQHNSSGLFEIRTYWLPDEKDHKVRSLSDPQRSEEKPEHSGHKAHVTIKAGVTKMRLTDPSLPETKSEKTSPKMSRNESNGFLKDKAHRFSEEISKEVTVFTTEQPADSKETKSVFTKKGVSSVQQKELKPREITSKAHEVKETTTVKIPVSYGEYTQGYLLNRYKVDRTEGSGMEGVVFRPFLSDRGIYETEEWKTIQKEHNGQNLPKEMSLDGITKIVQVTLQNGGNQIRRDEK